ncbi:MAG: molybdopterin cofactor-binding domain-containing protein [Hyphomicrobiaceae bacterium]
MTYPIETNTLKVPRRAFIVGAAAAGAGLTLGLRLPFDAAAVGAEMAPEVNAWVVVKPDETVVVRIARSEMGQGTLTGLAQLVAEELECDWANVTTEYPTPGQNLARKRVWGDFSTGGSRGIRASHQYVREGGAAARIMLIQAAASAWNVPASDCTTDKGVIAHKASGRTTTYGKVADAAAKVPAPKTVKLKAVKDWTIAGKPLKRLDTVDKVTGAQVYGFDLKLPGMLVATIKAAPVTGSKVKSFDPTKTKAMKGVKQVVPVGDTAVAVIADTFWHAKQGLDALAIEWTSTQNDKVSSESIAAWLKEGLEAPEAFVGNANGDAKAAIKAAAKTVEAVYDYPYLNHATMEPMNATALYTAEKCEVWCPTQNGESALAAAIKASGLPAEKVDVHKLLLGGGFGRRGMTDFVVQAVLIAKQMPGTPVKLLWTREEDMLHGRYHPVMQAKLVGSFDAQNNLTGLHVRLSGQSILASVAPQRIQGGGDPLSFQGLAKGNGDHAFGYSMPNLLIDHSMRNPHILPGFWRGVNVNQNCIFLECFMDELAHSVGADPLAFRRKFLDKHPKNLAVLNAVAERIDWEKPAPEGRFRGIAQMKAFGSYVAAAAEISVSGQEGNAIKVHRIVAATDPGVIVNPAQVERQIAGSFVYGLSAAFMQACTVKDGHMVEDNFDSFDSMRIAQMPKVEAILSATGGDGSTEPWGGVGEPTICVAAPAVLNAYFAATGKRIRSLPMKKHRIRLA